MIKPLGDRVLIEKQEAKEATQSGIILPESKDGGGTNIGTVIAIGEGHRNENGSITPLSVSVGQKVVFSWGEKIEIGNKEYHIVTEGSLLGIIEG